MLPLEAGRRRASERALTPTLFQKTCQPGLGDDQVGGGAALLASHARAWRSAETGALEMDFAGLVLHGHVDHVGSKARDRAILRELDAVHERTLPIHHEVHGAVADGLGGLDPEIVVPV